MKDVPIFTSVSKPFHFMICMKIKPGVELESNCSFKLFFHTLCIFFRQILKLKPYLQCVFFFMFSFNFTSTGFIHYQIFMAISLSS